MKTMKDRAIDEDAWRDKKGGGICGEIKPVGPLPLHIAASGF